MRPPAAIDANRTLWFLFKRISTPVHSSPVRLVTVSMLPSSCSGSIAGALAQPPIAHASAISATDAAMRQDGDRRRTDYHNVVNPGPRPTLRIATYNVHRCRGLDGRTRPERTAAVL